MMLSMPQDVKTINNRYQLLEQIGRGGMGEVFRARDRLSSQQVAVKLVAVPDELQRYDSSLGDELNPFLALAKEFELLATLKHPHVINVLDYGFDGPNRPYFTMDYLPGAKTIVEYGKLLSVSDKVQLFVNLLQALSYIHQRGIVHRDLKPSNVLVGVAGEVKVLDFGLSALQSPDMSDYGDFIGTLPYMAPEVLNAKAATVTSDLYAAGMLAYELFQGCYPFEYGDLDEMITAIQTKLPEFPNEIPINGVIAKLMAKRPEDRFVSVYDALNTIDQLGDPDIELESLEVRRSFLTAARFVGRDEELRQLEILVEKTSGGRSNAVLIGGESGVGKSRLVEELRKRALVVGVQVVIGQAVREQQSSFTLWQPIISYLLLSVDVSEYEAGILKSILPDIDDILEQPVQIIDDIRRVPDTLVQVISRYPDPLVLILEDLQWQADVSTVERLASEVDQALLVIGTYRNDERPDLPELLPSIQVMALERLDHRAMTSLSTAILGDAGNNPTIIDLLHRETEGNVFFVVETLNTLAENKGKLKQIGNISLPEEVIAKGVQQILFERIRRVPVEHYEVLKRAAVAGRQIDVEVIKKLSHGVDVEKWLYMCANYAILEPRNQQWRFVHDRVRDLILRQLDKGEKSLLHEQVAIAYENVYPNHEQIAAQLVELWHQANNPEREAYYAFVAGNYLKKLGQIPNAQNFAERAYQITLPLKKSELKAKILHLLGSIHYRLSNYEKAQTLQKHSLEIATDVAPPSLQVSILKSLGHVTHNTTDRFSSEQYYLRAIRLEQANDNNPSTLAKLFISLAERHPDRSLLLHYSQQALPVFRAGNDRLALAECLVKISAALITFPDEDPIPYLAEARNIFHEIGGLDGEARTLINFGVILIRRGDFVSALHYLDQAYDCAIHTGSSYIQLYVTISRIEATLLSGKLQKAHRYLNQMLPLVQQVSFTRRLGTYHFLSGTYHYYQKQFESAEQRYLKALDIQNSANDRLGKLETCGMLGAIATIAGDYGVAHNYLRNSIELAEEFNMSEAHAIILNQLGDLAVAENQYTDAYEYYQRALSNAQRTQFNLMVGHALLGFGKVFYASGHTDTATHTLCYLIQHVPCSFWTIKDAKDLLRRMGHEQLQYSEIFEFNVLMQKITEHRQT